MFIAVLSIYFATHDTLAYLSNLIILNAQSAYLLFYCGLHCLVAAHISKAEARRDKTRPASEFPELYQNPVLIFQAAASENLQRPKIKRGRREQ